MTATMEQQTKPDGSDLATLDHMLDGPVVPETTTFDGPKEDYREISPTGSFIMRAATRISTFLERRAMNKAHSEALQEDQVRKVTAQEEAEATYAENYAATAQREAEEAQFASDWDAAHRENDRFDARLARKERFEVAKDRLANGGQAALEAVKAVGLLTVGTGVLAGAAAGRKIQSGAETAALRAMYAKDGIAGKAKSSAETAALRAMYAKDAATDWSSEKVTSLREAWVNYRAGARIRKQFRHKRWLQKQEAIRSSYDRNVSSRIDVVRGVGSAVISHLRETKSVATATGKELADARKL